jgi:RNA polymerase sigma-70 factor (ECF subfamily)
VKEEREGDDYQTLDERHDNEIIRSILNGNADDFEIILKRYDAYVFTIVSRHLPREAVEEAAHEIFIRIYKSLPSYRAESPLKFWISKISTRYCYDYWREQYKSKEVPLASLTEEHSQWIESAVSGQSQENFNKEEMLKESREVLQWALGKLTAEERMVITLLYLDELPVKEAAALLGWTTVNVKVKAHRVRSKLRKIIASLLEKKGDK